MPLVVRIKTSDYITLRTTFSQKYHLPHKKLSDNPTILDLGCNVGYTILHFAYNYPNSRIIGVEMDCDNFKLAQRNTSYIKNCVLLNRAISISNGVVSYSNAAREDAYQITHERKVTSEEEIKVKSVTINSIIQQLNLKYIDYVKMDIEGEEVRIFDEHLSDLSWLNIVGMLNIEVHTSLLDIKRIIAILKNHNFDAWKDDHHWSSIRAIRV
jgi:FkbM family methyltransferase